MESVYVSTLRSVLALEVICFAGLIFMLFSLTIRRACVYWALAVPLIASLFLLWGDLTLQTTNEASLIDGHFLEIVNIVSFYAGALGFAMFFTRHRWLKPELIKPNDKPLSPRTRRLLLICGLAVAAFALLAVIWVQVWKRWLMC